MAAAHLTRPTGFILRAALGTFATVNIMGTFNLLGQPSEIFGKYTGCTVSRAGGVLFLVVVSLFFVFRSLFALFLAFCYVSFCTRSFLCARLLNPLHMFMHMCLLLFVPCGLWLKNSKSWKQCFVLVIVSLVSFFVCFLSYFLLRSFCV